MAIARWSLVGVATLAVAGVTVPVAAAADSPDRAVTAWIDRNSVPVETTDPDGPLDDLGSLRRTVGGATIVGLGESTHGSREQFRVKHRMVRYLVERLGFRTVAMEHDFAHGVVIDRYVTTGEGNPRAIVQGMGFPFYVCEEILDLIRWMRSYNLTHKEKVRFLGSDVIALRTISFNEVTAYVRTVAPDRVDELKTLLAPLRPTRPDHTRWYQRLPESERLKLIATARQARDLVLDVPKTAPRPKREYAQQHARTIVGWYEAFNNLVFGPHREVFIADTIAWWRRMVGGRVAYWAANAHMTKSPSVTYRHPGGGWTGRTAGGYLHQRLGRRYVAIGSVFGQGTISSNFAGPQAYPIAAAPKGLLDATLGQARRPQYLLDLRDPAPSPVRAWRKGPVTKRMILPTYARNGDGSDYVMTVPSLGGAFDALVYLRTTTATHLFTP